MSVITIARQFGSGGKTLGGLVASSLGYTLVDEEIVELIADPEYRINFMMDNHDLDRKQAQVVVDNQSKRRLNLYRYFARTDYDQPAHYHIVFNMNKVSLENAAQSVCQLAGGHISS